MSTPTTRLLLLASAALALSCSSALAQDDPFVWLEAPNSPAALKWASEQTDKTRTELSALPDYTAISTELKQSLGKAPPRPQFFIVGPHILRFGKSVAHPHGVLEVADRAPDGTPGAWRTVIDVDALRASEGKPLELQNFYLDSKCAPPDYNLCLFGFSRGGSDEGELREFDLAAGKFVEDGFRSPPGRNFYIWLDADTVLISSSATNDQHTPAGFSDAVRIWKRGTPLSAAPVVWHGEPNDKLILVASTGADARRLGVIEQVVDFSTFRSFIVEPGHAVRSVDLPFAVNWSLGATERHLIFQTTQPAVVGGVSTPANTIVAYDTDPATPVDRRLSIVYAPPPGEIVVSDAAVPQYAITRSAVNFVTMNHLDQHPMVARFRDDHWLVTPGEAAPIGTTVGYVAADKASDDFIRVTTGFIVPRRFDYMHDGAVTANLYQQRSEFDASGYTVETHTVKSADGTPIDYYLVRPKNVRHLGNVPTLITGYGGFDVTIQPDYLSGEENGEAGVTWFSRGGALALACIRGGGDQGEAWHRAATGINRQRAFDDFLAVSEDLERGFTSPKHVGVFGSSNGGLLAATVGIERPDLYGAVASDVPLTDMLRFPEMGAGGGWLDEFGDPRDPAVRSALLRYSPYQNVRDGVKYPPFMITTSTQDNRVGPGHARKLAARMEAVGAPVYLYESSEGGHGVSDPLERPDLMSLKMTFLIDELMPPSQAHGN